MDKGQRIMEQGTMDKGQRPLSDVLCPPSTVPSNLRIPFAVHTAKFGYDWSNVPEGMTRKELDACYRAAIAAKPEYLEPGQIISGVASAVGRKFAYSIQVAEAWDANGRNAEYSAFAFIPAILADRLFVEGLLKRDEFCRPNRNPPTSVPCEIVHVPPNAGIAAPTPIAPSAPEAPKPAPSVRRPTSAIDGETDWVNVLIWICSAVAALIAIIAACKR